MKFYDPTGIEFSNPEEFVDYYSKCYFLNNSKVAEDEIMKLFNLGIQEPMDVMRILEWKLGRIDQKRSQCEGKTFFRHEDLMKEFKTKTRSGEIDAKELSYYIAKHYKRLKEKDPSFVFQKLTDIKVDNLGTVYIITLVYFITQKCPIYDRFAHQAILAITGDKPRRPGDIVPYKSLPDKTAKNAYSRYDTEYVKKLREVFNNYMSREVDQALWVYGHLFRQ